jgi:hypothetical protein
MTITSLSYNRQTGGAAGVWITVANDLQKVTAVASPFTEFGAGGYTCKVEVSYLRAPIIVVPGAYHTRDLCRVMIK